MEQDTSNIISPETPRRGFSRYKLAALILAIAAVLIVVGAIFVPRLIKPRGDIKATATATITASVSATLSATKTQSPIASAVGTKSTATDVSGGSRDSSDQATATSGSNDGATSGAASCTALDFNLNESQCSSQTPEKVCGIIKYIYDNGEEATHSSTFNNVCEYCAQFDGSGFLELRGAKMYSKGYSMGQCQ